MGSLSQAFTNIHCTGSDGCDRHGTGKCFKNTSPGHLNTYHADEISGTTQNTSVTHHSDGDLSRDRIPGQGDSCVIGVTSTHNKMSDEVSVPGSTIPEMVEYWGSTSENEITAFVSIDQNDRKRTLNRKEVLDLSKRFAHKLNSLGIKKGSVVCNTLPNSLERVVCEFGIQFSGAASMNGQILRSDGEDFLEALKTSQCVAVITDPNVPKSAWNILLKVIILGCESSIKSERLPHLERLILCSRDDINIQNDFITCLRDPDHPQFQADVSPTDTATILTTSGSTGYSKLVKLTHANICHFCKQVKAIEPLPSGAHFLNCAQLGWAGGYPQWFLSSGVTRHFIDMHDGPPSDLPALLWKIMVQEKIVYGFLTPMYVNAILTNCPWQNADWKPKYLCLAGQPIKKGHLDIIGKLCEAVDVNYGMTECNVVTTHRIVDPSDYIDGCAGYPGYGVQIKIVDVNRQEVPLGTTGEILLRSPSLCSGYLNNESASAAFTSDGWFCTDDAGYIGYNGKVYVEGRQSDSILRGVYILYPGWLEKKMRELPGVLDVAIVAVPDEVLYTEICACIVVKGVKGVVAGRLHNAESKSTDSHYLDEVDNAAFIDKLKLSPTPLSSSLDVIEPGCANKSCSHIEDHQDVDKQLKNETKDKPDNCEESNKLPSSKQDGETKEESLHNANLISLEKELRNFANDVNMLHENDAMRMVPKYYIFMDTFPVTSNGKISRKEIRKIAAATLGLK